MKKTFCSKCGMPVKRYPIALRNKMRIIEVVDPHECDDSFMENIKDSPQPMESFRPLSEDIREREPFVDPSSLSDKRDKKFLRTTAPSGIISAVKGDLEDE